MVLTSRCCIRPCRALERHVGIEPAPAPPTERPSSGLCTIQQCRIWCRSFPAVSVTLRSACLHRTVLAQWRVTACARSYPYFPRRQHTLRSWRVRAVYWSGGQESNLTVSRWAILRASRGIALVYRTLPFSACLPVFPGRQPAFYQNASVGSNSEARELNPRGRRRGASGQVEEKGGCSTHERRSWPQRLYRPHPALA